MGLYKRGQVWWMSFVYAGKRIRKSTETENKGLAEFIHAKVKSSIIEGKWFDVVVEKEITFRELMDRYMKEHSRVKKKSWQRDLVSISHLLPFFGFFTLAEITPSLISKYKAQRYTEKASPATINRELALMKHAFNLAIKEWEWCRENPICKMKMEKENNARERWLDYDEEERLLKACPKWLKEIVIFALNTGMRQGEILNLTWKDVDFFRNVVVVYQGKTSQKKTIPLIPTILEILKEKAKIRYFKNNLVFPSQNGTMITSSNLGRAFRFALKKAKIDDFRFHDLRHTFATRLVQAGVDLYIIQKLLGHRDPRMVQRYAHHSTESLRDGIEILERLKQKTSGKNVSQFSHNLSVTTDNPKLSLTKVLEYNRFISCAPVAQ